MPLQSKLSSDFKKISDTVDMSLLHLMDKDERGQSEISEDRDRFDAGNNCRTVAFC